MNAFWRIFLFGVLHSSVTGSLVDLSKYDEHSLEDLAYLSHLAQEVPFRHDDFLGLTTSVLIMSESLSDEAVTRFASASMSVLGHSRKNLDFYGAAAKHKSKLGNSKLSELAFNKHNAIYREIFDMSYRLFKLLDEERVAAAASNVSKVVLLRLKADYLRYMSEYLQDNGIQSDPCVKVTAAPSKEYSGEHRETASFLAGPVPSEVGPQTPVDASAETHGLALNVQDLTTPVQDLNIPVPAAAESSDQGVVPDAESCVRSVSSAFGDLSVSAEPCETAGSREAEGDNEYYGFTFESCSSLSRKFYSDALSLAESTLEVSDMTRLGVVLNYSALLCDVLSSYREALDMQEKALDEAVDQMVYDHDRDALVRTESTISRMRQNISYLDELIAKEELIADENDDMWSTGSPIGDLEYEIEGVPSGASRNEGAQEENTGKN